MATYKPSKLSQLADKKTASQLQTMSRESLKWLMVKIGHLRNVGRVANAINKEDFRHTKQLRLGGLYYFFYDAKGKNTLPYYDQFPMVLILERYDDGFLGLNLHYLPVRQRIAFLDKLMLYATLTPENDVLRIRVTYDILNAVKRFKEFRPCLKRYLFAHMRSKMLTIQPDEWDIAAILPVQKFSGATAKQVWEDSMQDIKGEADAG
jgi:hypothetical protein